MALPPVGTADAFGERTLPSDPHEHLQDRTIAVSWGAIVAGATAMAALSLILLILGTGLDCPPCRPGCAPG